MKNKNILITGGAGFIGSHIANELMDDNNITIFSLIGRKDLMADSF